MTIKYERHTVYPDSILVKNFKGKTNVNDIIASWEYLFRNNNLDSSLKGIINNLIECDLQMNMTSFGQLITYLNRHEIFKKIKLAVVCNNPSIIIFPTLGEIEHHELNIKPFTTEEAASAWIMGENLFEG